MIYPDDVKIGDLLEYEWKPMHIIGIPTTVTLIVMVIDIVSPDLIRVKCLVSSNNEITRIGYTWMMSKSYILFQHWKLIRRL